MVNMEVEIWLPVGGFEDRYEVSNYGRVRSLDTSHFTGRNVIFQKGKIRKNVKDSDGYLQVLLSRNNKSRPGKIHRLVAKSFIPNPGNLETVNHIDFDTTNNRVDNLEWMSRAENHLNAIKNGRMRNNGRNLPEEGRKKSKPVLQYDLSGNFIKEYVSINDAVRQTDCNISGIVYTAQGKQPQTKGFIWKYKDQLQLSTS